ncbi:MAG: hypothetical protein IT552_12075 [Sphingomonadaceae bacterium]|nr:hypothetical protein [Sphingomonadaceae bacterium]
MTDRTITVAARRGYCTLLFDPPLSDGESCGLPISYSSAWLATEAALRLKKEKGWQFQGGGDDR